MTEPSRRPKGLKVPKLSPSKPVPKPASIEAKPEAGGRDGPEATRYGDWEIKGIAVDF
jgi:hypothetical protein